MSPLSRSSARRSSGSGRRRAPATAAAVRVLELDRELGSTLEPESRALAQARSQALVLGLARGAWEPPIWPEGVRRGIGLLLLEGLIRRRIEIGRRTSAELLAAGDLLRPWQSEDAAASLPLRPAWDVLEHSRLAVLDLEFARRLSPFPEIQGELVERALRRSRHLAANAAIVHQPRVEARVQMILWQLADRFGSVRADGVLLPLRLTHMLLAELVAARRPTVSVAIAALERSGELSRPADGGWLLHGTPAG
jgi:hypothetical protein